MKRSQHIELLTFLLADIKALLAGEQAAACRASFALGQLAASEPLAFTLFALVRDGAHEDLRSLTPRIEARLVELRSQG